MMGFLNLKNNIDISVFFVTKVSNCAGFSQLHQITQLTLALNKTLDHVDLYRLFAFPLHNDLKSASLLALLHDS